jgi:DNA-binding transcriptional LysR family regulator
MFGNDYCRWSNSMQLKALRFFAKVAASGSFVATARHYRVPASSVSRHIAALEREIGQQLLFRHTRAVRLTDAGERYYQQVREALEQLDLAAEAAAGIDAPPSGVLRVNAPLALGRLHIAPLLIGFQQQHDALTVELTLTDAFIDPVQEGADLTVRVGRLNDSGLIARQLGEQRYLLCASPGYLSRHGEPRSPTDLTAHNCLLYKGPRGAQRWYFRRADRPAYEALDVSGNLRGNNAESLVAAAVADQGLVLFPSWLYSEQMLRSGALRVVLADWQASVDAEPQGIHLLYPENRLRSAKVRLLTDYLLEHIGQPPYWDRPVAVAV